jgi:hypothetical protein
MKKTKKVKMTFEVLEDLDIMIDEESLKTEFDGDIYKFCKWLYKEEGMFWNAEMRLVKSEILTKR